MMKGSRFSRNCLSDPLPDLSIHPGVTPATAETWALFQLVARVREVYGAELLGPVVISMCRSAADVLSVLLLARWTSCNEGLQIVPLFETIEDLRAAPSIMENLFTLPIYREHLSTCGDEQMVMIGYSDSNKDGGYVMANWALYQGQENITRVAQNHKITLTIFHGRGGTTARGGGPANRAIRAQPAGSINGRFRLTEQGENISARYSNLELPTAILSKLSMLCCWRPLLQKRRRKFPLCGVQPWMKCPRRRTSYIADSFMRLPALLSFGSQPHHWMRSNECTLMIQPCRVDDEGPRVVKSFRRGR